MIWLAAAAHAAEPAPPVVRAVVPFTLDEASPPGMVPGRPAFAEGALLVLTVDPATAVPTQGLARSWWLGDQPLRSWGADPVGGCVVLLVEGPVDPRAAPLFLGPALLPERLDATAAAAHLADAVAAGARPLPASALDAVTEPVRRLPHAGALNPLADARMAACTGSPPPTPPVPLR